MQKLEGCSNSAGKIKKKVETSNYDLVVWTSFFFLSHNFLLFEKKICSHREAFRPGKSPQKWEVRYYETDARDPMLVPC